jgi:hypothetical protein
VYLPPTSDKAGSHLLKLFSMMVSSGISREWNRVVKIPAMQVVNSGVLWPCKVRGELLGNEKMRPVSSTVSAIVFVKNKFQAYLWPTYAFGFKK